MKVNLKELEKKFNTNLDGGLKDEQILANREIYGSNELVEKKKKNIVVRFLMQFADILIIILLLAAVISIIIDPSEWIDSLIIFIVVIVNALLGVFQENKAEKSLEALKKMTASTTKVFRNNSLITIDSKELVVGDIIYVEAGDSISADATIIECSNLKVEEASLTGESVPVEKNADYIEDENLPIGDLKNCLFSSTYVTNGKAKAVVTAVGMSTQIGKIAGMLTEEDNSKTPLQNKLAQVGKMIGLLALGICVVVFGLELIAAKKNGADLSTEWLECFKTAIALAVAAIPEGLATVVTIVLAIGVSKMSKKNAIVKKLPAVETLGSCNVVCSDKTGTLTQNKMTVVKIYANNIKDVESLTEEETKMINYFAICCDASINNVNGKIERIGDPTELALLDINLVYGEDINKVNRIMDLPFDSERKLMTTVIKDNDRYLAITKGAPDNIINLCNNDYQTLENAKNANKEMAENALRVLGLGIKYFDKIPQPEELERDLNFVGLVGMIDPARQEVKEAIKIAKQAGIKTVMITGDYIVTAKAIAKELGIMEEGDLAISSTDLDKISDEELARDIDKYRVFARVAPKDKVRIVEAWQKNDAIVAMTGDGVNDAPALKKADIGCAMGITGTEVSKQAADMILTDDNYSTIIYAVKEGRGIYNNIQKCVKYLLSSNIGEVLTIFIASLIAVISNINVGIPLLPIHLLWINLITDSLPAFGIGMEEVEDSVMKNKPRSKKTSFFADKLGTKIIIEGFIVGGVTLISYLLGVFVFNDQKVAQTMAFFTLSSTQLLHAYNVKSEHSIFSKYSYKNKFMNFAFLIGFLLQFMVIYCPGINDIFKLSSLSFPQIAIAFLLSCVIVVIMEIVKLINRKKK